MEGKKEGGQDGRKESRSILLFLLGCLLDFSSLNISTKDLLCLETVICRHEAKFWATSATPTIFFQRCQE